MNGGSWAGPTLFLLGAYHGINPGMGWLFAVALGMQEKSRAAVARSLIPLAVGHGLAVAAVVIIAAAVQTVVPIGYLRIGVAVILVGFGVLRLVRHRHPRWVGMRVGFRDLTLWSLLMASAHGAGIMVLPVVLATAAGEHSHLAHHSTNALVAVVIHTSGYLIVTGLVALAVYQWLGLALLRKAWLNLDLVWAGALVATGCATLFL
ncbi:MAG: hypothetical protein ACRD8O_23570 [Bryobacteraceae bacterium]